MMYIHPDAAERHVSFAATHATFGPWWLKILSQILNYYSLREKKLIIQRKRPSLREVLWRMDSFLKKLSYLCGQASKNFGLMGL